MKGNHFTYALLESLVAGSPLFVLVILCITWGRLDYLKHCAEVSFAGLVFGSLALLRFIEHFGKLASPAKLTLVSGSIVVFVIFPNLILLIRMVTMHFEKATIASGPQFLHIFMAVLAYASLLFVGLLSDRHSR